ncbi:piggyBac transposable element-derived protein 4-like [Vespula squamosa]|uniref:PiggyBac transposable element-derived protein 4-like n=1 Tax=Vespula squamosa TaxID=30214 RepID=A0ABD2BAY7_VESSQ
MNSTDIKTIRLHCNSLRVAYQARNLSISHLWNSKWGLPCFCQTMGRNAFIEILKFLRFDEKTQRSKRLKTDKFALISHVWNRFIENRQNNYKPDMNLTVDEQLFPTTYTIYATGFPYLRKEETRPSSITLGEFVVLKLKCYDGKFFHEHITGDKIIGKTNNILGTIRSNRREFPKLSKSAKDELKLLNFRFSVLYKSDNCTLTIHKSKPINKITIIINTKHKSVQINNDRKRLPETVITKLNSASMSPVKWQESTASNQNHIDGLYKFFSTSLIFSKQVHETYPDNQEFILKIAEELFPRRKGRRTRNIKFLQPIF